MAVLAERELKLRQQEQQRLAEEQTRVSSLISEKQNLELKLAEVMKRSSDDASRKTSLNTFTFEDKEKLENQLHDMAVMVERLESGRQKLLLEERFYFGDHVPCFETGIPLLKQRLHELLDANKIIVAFPDDGAWKRFHKLLDLSYVREGGKRIVRVKEGNPAGYHVVIVDDLVQSGGTLIECQKVLKAHGAAKVRAYVTHAVFLKSSFERFTHKNYGSDEAFSYFWITDSCPRTVKAIQDKAPFEVLSLAGSISNALQI